MMRTTTLPFRFYDNVEELSTEESRNGQSAFSLENIKSLDLTMFTAKRLCNERKTPFVLPRRKRNLGRLHRRRRKTVIASKAAKISMRLVPIKIGRNHWIVHQTFHQHCLQALPYCSKPSRARLRNPNRQHWLQTANMAYTFGVPAIPVRSGGSILL
jgi:hypothetical protein